MDTKPTAGLGSEDGCSCDEKPRRVGPFGCDGGAEVIRAEAHLCSEEDNRWRAQQPRPFVEAKRGMKAWARGGGGPGDLMGLVFTGTGGRERALEMESQRVQPGFGAVAPRLLPTVASARWEPCRGAGSKQSLTGRRGADCSHLLVELRLCWFCWSRLR